MKATYTINTSITFDLAIAQINLDVDINPRQDGLDRSHIDMLKCDTPNMYPPVLVATLDGVTYIIIDGYHRVQATIEQHVTHLKANLVTFTRSDYDNNNNDKIPEALILAAYDANSMHGKPLSVQERKEYAFTLYLCDNSLNWLQLSKKVKLSDKTIKAYVTQQLSEDDESSKDTVSTTHKAEITNAAKLLKALRTFYTQEHTLLSTLGTANKPRDVQARATALYKHIATLPKEQHTNILQELTSLQETLNVFTAMVQKPKAKRA